VLDLPFGPTVKKIPPLFRSRVPTFIAELARVLRPSTGRCVLLSQTLQRLQVCLDSRFFAHFRSREVNVGGYLCYLVTATRSEAVWTSDADGDEEGEETKAAKRQRT